MPDEPKEATRDEIDLFVLGELERVNAVLDVLIAHTGVPEKAIALARLKCEMKNLERARTVALSREDFNEMMDLGAKYDEVQRQIKSLESAVA